MSDSSEYDSSEEYDEEEENEDEDDALLEEVFAMMVRRLRMTGSLLQPRRKQHKDVLCKFFLQGHCREGDHCRFSHDLRLCPPSSGAGAAAAAESSEDDEDEDEDRAAAAAAAAAPDTRSLRPCKFFLAGNCLRGECCPFSHDPDLLAAATSQQQQQQQQQHVCAVCLEPPEHFGLLSGCDHCFCLACIRQWRGQAAESEYMLGAARKCPCCRAHSDYVVPSKVFLVGDAKQRFITSYRAALASTPCKYYTMYGSCPFGADCFYKH